MELHIEASLGCGGHKDLLLSIPQLGVEVCADTYYFVMALEGQKALVSACSVRQGISGLLEYWHSKAASCKDGETIFLPFDFSDQYTGCLQIVCNHQTFRLSYGFSLIEGCSVNPLEPGDYFKQVRDFKACPASFIEVERDEFLCALQLAISKIEGEVITTH